MAADSTTTGNGRRLGAYGLSLSGVEGAESLLVAAADDWPPLTVERIASERRLEREEVTEDRAELVLRTGGSLAIDRATGIVRFSTSRRLTNDELVHPFLAPAAAVMAHWSMRSCLHAGAFVHGGKVWALLGEREGGKSSTLAWLALHGHEVVTDDVLVLEGDSAFAGPRAIDLREEAAAELGIGTNLGRVGARDRHRYELPPIVGRVPVGGCVFLRWANTLALRRLAAAEVLGRLLAQRALRITPANPADWLDLAALPGWELARPREWSELPAALETLLETLAGSA